MNRLEEFREKARRMNGSDEATVGEAYDALEDYIRDIPHLLARVGHLQDEAEALHIALVASGERMAEIEAENEGLKKDNRRLTSLYYQPQAQEVMNKLVELEAENGRLRDLMMRAGLNPEDGEPE